MMKIWGVFLLYLSLANGTRLPRVIGGTEAAPHERPYQGSFYAELSGAKSFICSGSIISENWVLTSANCLANRVNESNIWFGTGITSFIKPFDRYKVFKIIIHPDYKYNSEIKASYEGDIAMVMIDGSIQFSKEVIDIALPLQDNQNYNAPGEFGGWGPIAVNTYTERLHKIDLNIISLQTCRKYWDQVTDKHICTLNQVGEGFCGMDSGAPLVIGGVQVGIASYSRDCAQGAPDVFTKVFPYINWIFSTQAQNSYISFSIHSSA